MTSIYTNMCLSDGLSNAKFFESRTTQQQGKTAIPTRPEPIGIGTVYLETSETKSGNSNMLLLGRSSQLPDSARCSTSTTSSSTTSVGTESAGASDGGSGELSHAETSSSPVLMASTHTHHPISNQASEAQIHFMVEFAKRLRECLGKPVLVWCGSVMGR